VNVDGRYHPVGGVEITCGLGELAVAGKEAAGALDMSSVTGTNCG